MIAHGHYELTLVYDVCRYDSENCSTNANKTFILEGSCDFTTKLIKKDF